MLRCSMLCSLFSLLLIVTLPSSLADTVTRIKPATQWNDTQGQRIEAHGMSIIRDPITQAGWWMYGENAKSNDVRLHGVNCYYSTDLLNWQSFGEVFNQANITNLKEPVTIERPKILYDANTATWILWLHIDPNSYSLREIATAVSSTPQGPFTFVRRFQPDNLPSLDMTVYQETDANGRLLAAYLIRSVDNAYVGISKLSNDLLDTTGLISVIPTPREAHTMFKHNDLYYMLTSHLTGWAANPAELFVSNKNTLFGAEWTSLGNPTGSATTYDAQPAFIFPFVTNSNTSYFIAAFDRWSYPTLTNATNIWLPINIDAKSSKVTISYVAEWDLQNPFAITPPVNSLRQRFAAIASSQL